MSDTITTERPKPKRRKAVTPALRRRIEEAVDRMIDALDALDAPAEDREPDDEGSDDEKEGDGDSDDEPSLGAPEHVNLARAWKHPGEGEGEDIEGDELDTKEASDLEISGESDTDSMGGGTVDDEPSLGSLDRRMNQTKWCRPDYTPRGAWNIATDAEDDGLVRGEGDDADQEVGIEDQPHDADTDQDGCPSKDGVPFMFGGDRRGDVVVPQGRSRTRRR